MKALFLDASNIHHTLYILYIYIAIFLFLTNSKGMIIIII